MHVVCDTDFLSSFLKIGRLELVKEFFGVDNIHIPVAVLYEIAVIVGDLKKMDYYEFSYEEERRLSE